MSDRPDQLMYAGWPSQNRESGLTNNPRTVAPEASASRLRPQGEMAAFVYDKSTQGVDFSVAANGLQKLD